LATAQLTIVEANLTVGATAQRASSTIPSGSVISQSPGAGIEVTAGTAVSLIVSTGSVQTAVPNVVGLTRTQAQLAITLAGFALGSVVGQESTLPVNQVISQIPSAGTLAAPGTEVDLIISAGVSPTTVPNLIGLAQTSALDVLQLAGFILGTVTTQPSPTVPAGTVLDQEPVAGTFAPAGSAINLVVSEGVVLVQVPNVVGLPLEQAATLIVNAQLLVGTVIQQRSQQAAGTVLSQTPAAGVSANAGEPVNLVISQGSGTLGRPLTLTASQGTFSGFVRLTWEPVVGAAHYQVLRSNTISGAGRIDLATVAETTYDDTTALPPTVSQVSGGCFASAGTVVVYNNYYYWVQALSATAASELSGPVLGYRGLATAKGLDLVRVKALPSSNGAGGVLRAQPGDSLAVRLSSRDAIAPGSVWGLIAIDGGAEQGGVQWRPLPGSGGTDGWVVYAPPAPFQVGQTIRFRAGATTVTGFEILETSEFLISESMAPDATTELWQPDFSAAPGKAGSDEVHVRVSDMAALPPLPEAVTPAYAIGPEQVFQVPQQVWLPAPAPFDPADLEAYVLVSRATGAEWWPATRVQGFLEPGETARAEAEGVLWVGLVVRHGGVVCLGKKLPESCDTGGADLSDNVMVGGAALMALAVAVVASRRR
ncbi:MAG: PASTA domain-containing protein, partial [Candidatus Hydrogenedentes bacterium]|nr:PASTA domain-containing protein [Candidatus Hydrogenedentota bacterium]